MASIVKRSKDTQLAQLKLEKVDNSQYKFGAEKPFMTEFLFLNKNKEDADDFEIKDQKAGAKKKTNAKDEQDRRKVCLKYGQGILLLNEEFCAMLALNEVRAGIQKNLLLE